jgi:cation:H+ antiporter
MSRDLSFFLAGFSVALVMGVVDAPAALKIGVAGALIAFYGFYVWRTLQGGSSHGQELKPLYLHRGRAEPATFRVAFQTVLGLGAIIGGAHLFVQAVSGVAEDLGVPAIALSLLIAPLATELPEKFNSVLWIRDRKDTLALGNITGAMVFQSTIPVCVGLALTPWELDRFSIVAAALALASGAIAWVGLRLRRRISWPTLALGLPFYVAFVAFVIVQVG